MTDDWYLLLGTAGVLSVAAAAFAAGWMSRRLVEPDTYVFEPPPPVAVVEPVDRWEDSTEPIMPFVPACFQDVQDRILYVEGEPGTYRLALAVDLLNSGISWTEAIIENAERDLAKVNALIADRREAEAA
jgi:hypothetical protein